MSKYNRSILSVFLCLLPQAAFGQKELCEATHIADAPAYNFTHSEPPVAFQKRDDLFELYMFPGWFKPTCGQNSYRGCSRMIMQLTPDGKALLNPKSGDLGGLSSGHIELRGIKLADAEMLWGEGRKAASDSNIRTFDLLTSNPAERNLYHFDARFENNVLTAYRLRGNGITKPAWVQAE